jgi:hypothetical protein
MAGLMPGPAPAVMWCASKTRAGPKNCATGTLSPVMEPAQPALGRFEPSWGMKCAGASKCVPVCSSSAIHRV